MDNPEEVLSDFHKKIYNVYLKTRATQQNRPYRYRKNFKNFKYTKDVLKIGSLFSNYPHIDVDKYFEAPYKVWDTKEIYNIDFYSKRKALNCYVNYKKMLLSLHPDDPYHLNKLISGFYFIKEFCLTHKLELDEYIDHKDGIYSFLSHLKNDNVSIYNLFSLDGFKNKFRDDVDGELKNTLFSDLYIDYDMMYRRFINSKKCRILSKKCLKKLRQSVNIKI
jgi:hypothetical protein